ncbi:GntR family transcriptional regulator [Gammaproteobacteria bacterium AS21]
MSDDEKIYKKILKAIVEHQLPPGSRLPEDKLSEAFGVSRTGIRKVLHRLALEHFVVITRNKGAQVNHPSEEEALEVFDSRILVEPQLMSAVLKHWKKENSDHFRDIVTQERLAQENSDLAGSIQITARFHYELARLAGNSVLAAFVEQLCYRSSLVIAAFGTVSSVGGVSCDCGDHVQLLDLLDKGDSEAVQQWMLEHLQSIKGSLILAGQDEQNIDFNRLFS